MGNKINNEENSLKIEEESIKPKIICPKCPLIPIINITSTQEGTLICEYRCPSFHFGIVKLEEMIFNKNRKNKKHGFICERCKKDISEEKLQSEKRFKFCGICKIFLCGQCIEEHNKLKTNHRILVHSKINNYCLEHETKYKFYCFTCLKSLCTKCVGHTNHSFKDLKDIEPNEELLDKLKYYFNEIKNYFNCIEKSNVYNKNKEKYLLFKKKNSLVLCFVLSLYEKYLKKKRKNSLNGEIIINLINLTKFDLNTKKLYINSDLYFNTHIIIKNTPVSSICAFTYAKANYKVGELTPLFFKDLNTDKYESMIILRMDYNLIGYNIGETLYFMKDEEEVYFKVSISEEIIHFCQLKEHIVGVCSKENIYFYKLLKLEPYIVQINVLIPPLKNIFQIYGNIYDNLYALNCDNIYKLVIKKEKKEVNSEFDFILEIECSTVINMEKIMRKENKKNNSESSHIHRSIDSMEEEEEEKEEEKEIKEEEEEEEEDSELFQNNLLKDKFKQYEEEGKYEEYKNEKLFIKGIVFNYIIVAEKCCTKIRNKNSFVIKTILDSKNFDYIIYNDHILFPDNKNIIFYSIPNLKVVSIITVSEPIFYFLIPNKYMLLLIGRNSIEQLELNTWKKVSKYFNTIYDFKKDNCKIIGNNKELYLFEEDKIYKFEQNL